MIKGASLTKLGQLKFSIEEIQAEVSRFILRCLGKDRYPSLNDARVAAWCDKMASGVKNKPPLCTFPVTEEGQLQNTLRAHLQQATWLSALDEDPPNVNKEEFGFRVKKLTDDIQVCTIQK